MDQVSVLKKDYFLVVPRSLSIYLYSDSKQTLDLSSLVITSYR